MTEKMCELCGIRPVFGLSIIQTDKYLAKRCEVCSHCLDKIEQAKDVAIASIKLVRHQREAALASGLPWEEPEC